MRSNHDVGMLGESIAAEFLVSLGYEIVQRNWRCQYGEIDIVALEDGVWAFVEVKSRIGQKYGLAVEAITPQKRLRMLHSALSYLAARNDTTSVWRLDVVAIQMNRLGKAQSIVLFRNAIEE